MVRYVPCSETIVCERCHDAKIHSLVLCCIGKSDLMLLCKSCLAKDAKPTSRYSLGDDSLLKQIPDYYKRRGIKGSNCCSKLDCDAGDLSQGKVIECRNCVDPQVQDHVSNRSRQVVQTVAVAEIASIRKDSSKHLYKDGKLRKKTWALLDILDATGEDTHAQLATSIQDNVQIEAYLPRLWAQRTSAKLARSQVTTKARYPSRKPFSLLTTSPVGQSNESSDVNLLNISPNVASPDAILHYHSIEEYCQRWSYNLFLEELRNPENRDTLLDSSDMLIEWFIEQDMKHDHFKMNMTLTRSLLDRLISKKIQAYRLIPLIPEQTVFVFFKDDIAWYGNVISISLKDETGPDEPIEFEAKIKLYRWNHQPLPTSGDKSLLHVLPATAPASRCFKAMLNLNPTLTRMILGNEPINHVVLNLKYVNKSLNPSQRCAIQSVLENPITMLQGPPGTGKTATIVELLKHLERLHYPILVLAASNIAVDNIAEKMLLTHEKSIVRVVANIREPDYSRDHVLGPICLHHRVYDALPTHMREIFNRVRDPHTRVQPAEFKLLVKKQIEIGESLLRQSRVVLTTNISAGGLYFRSNRNFRVIVIDEATQSTEATTLIPLLMPEVEKFVLVGDQRQLSSFTRVPNMLLSLFERVLSNGTYSDAIMLDTQYRMHPMMSDFPRRVFYGGLLKDGLTSEQRRWGSAPIRNPVCFWDTLRQHPEEAVRIFAGPESRSSYRNIGEATLIVKVLCKLIFDKGVPKSDIGVITPYSAQRDEVSAMLQANEMINPDKDDVSIKVDKEEYFGDAKPVSIHVVAGIMVASVDAFQGREKDFIVMSCVRSNRVKDIGFVKDRRRMNVGLTRARFGLIFVGDVDCLSGGDPLWKDYLSDLRRKGCIHVGPEFIY